MCKICGLTTNDVVYNKISYKKCPNCDFLCKTDEFIVDSKKECERYQHHDNDDNNGYLVYQTNFYEMIKDYLGTTSLDFGCGNNHILANIISKQGIESSYYDLYFYPNSDYKTKKYDSIILEEVIEHLYDPIAILKELYPLLNTNGVFIIRTNLLKDGLNLNNWWYLRDITHISFFSEKTFVKISEFLNMNIIYCNSKDLIILQKV